MELSVGFCFFYYRSLTLIKASAYQRQSAIINETNNALNSPCV